LKKLDLKINLKKLDVRQKKTLIKECAFAAVLILFDWLTKLAAFSLLKDKPDGVPVIDGLLILEAIRNDGIAFGMFDGYSRLFGVISIIVSVAIAWYFLKNTSEHRLMKTGLLLIFAGGVANGCERIIYNFVRDFLNVPFYSVFNFADVYVVGGAAVLIVYILFFAPKDEKKPESETDNIRSDITAQNAIAGDAGQSALNDDVDNKTVSSVDDSTQNDNDITAQNDEKN
jgi:signal peptidase II